MEKNNKSLRTERCENNDTLYTNIMTAMCREGTPFELICLVIVEEAT